MEENANHNFRPISLPEEHHIYISHNAKAAKLIDGDPNFPIEPGQVGLAWDDPDDPPNEYTFYFEHSDWRKYLYLAFGEELEWIGMKQSEEL